MWVLLRMFWLCTSRVAHTFKTVAICDTRWGITQNWRKAVLGSHKNLGKIFCWRSKTSTLYIGYKVEELAPEAKETVWTLEGNRVERAWTMLWRRKHRLSLGTYELLGVLDSLRYQALHEKNHGKWSTEDTVKHCLATGIQSEKHVLKWRCHANSTQFSLIN